MTASLKSRLPQIAAELLPRISVAVKESAERISENAQSRAPIDEGDLRDAIHVERVGPAEYAVVAGDEDVFYGHFLEFGTTKRPAHPFLIPAAESEMPLVEARVTAVLRGL